MSTLRIASAQDAAMGPASVLPAAPEDLEALEDSPRYCPTRMLATFALLMAGRGRCVNTDMMLGDREYALWQLACARATDDDELAAVVQRLSAYFGEPQDSGFPVLGTA